MGRGEQLLPLPMALVDTVHIKFDEAVVIAGDQLEIVGLNSGEEYELAFQDFDTQTNVGTWKLTSGAFGADRIWMRLNDSVVDLQGNQLDGEWLNPVGPGSTRDVLPFSGDTIAGGDFTYAFVVLPGDGNQDWFVDASDFNVWNSNNFTINTNWETGDYNGDGVTDASDFNIWNNHQFTTVQLTTFTDLDHDGDTDEDDVFYLFDAIFGRRAAETFDDLNGDGVVNDEDVFYLLDILETVLGDITLDGVANTDDLNLFLEQGSDVDNDGDIDMYDYFDFFYY